MPYEAKIELNRGFLAIVDADDVEWLRDFNWSVVGRKGKHYAYAISWSMKLIAMHWAVLNHDGIKVPSKCVIDHINGNGLDNRRSNLRVASVQQNAWNQKARTPDKCASPYKGVWYAKDGKRRKRWCSKIKANGKRYHLGYFATDVEAALAYDAAAKERFGEFARLNFGN